MTTTLDQAQRAFVRTAEQLPTLFAIEEQLLPLMDALETPDAELDDDQRALLASLETMLEQRVETYCHVIELHQQLQQTREAAYRRLRDKAQAHANVVERLKERLKQHMLLTGRERIETAEYSVRIQRNSRPSINVLDAGMVAPEFHRIKVIDDIDKDRILEELKSTGEVPEGVEVVHGSHLRIS